jgi:hypothetical protein
MRCNHARRLLARKVSREISPHKAKLLADHLGTCPQCAGLEDQLERAWSALGHHPSVEPSPGSLPRLKARLRAEQTAQGAGRTWRRDLRWQWIALAACLLLAAVLLTTDGQLRRGAVPPDQGLNLAVDRDSWDEQFLQDLEQTLQRSDAEYLSAYDSWPGAANEAVRSLELPKTGPAGRTRKRESS